MLQFSPSQKAMIWALCALGFLLTIPNAFYDRVERSNDAKTLIEESGITSPELEAEASLWPSYLPSSLVNLGLDLRGGAHLLAEVQLQEVYEERLEGYWAEIRTALRNERAVIGTFRRQESPPDIMRIRISQAEGIARAVEVIKELASPVQSLTGLSTTDILVTALGDVITVTLSEEEKQATDERTMAQSLEIIRRRIDEAGTREPTIQRQGADRILIQVPGIGSAEELKALIGKTAKLSFHKVISATTDAGVRVTARQLLSPSLDEAGVYYILERSPTITGENLVDSQPSFDQNGQPAVSFRLNPTGARIFGNYTATNIGNRFAIVLDGETVSAPVINSHIPGGSGIITGRFSVEEVTTLSIQLRAGALPASVQYLEERTVGPELGQDSIEAGELACLVAFIAILIFMGLSYGVFGLFANVALVMNIFMLFGLLSLIGATLTLPGIAGIVLTLGMAVDANVLVFERIREELKSTKTPIRAIELGYERAISAIIDANITTFIAALILYIMGSGPVKGFAITLGFGIITSVFSSIFITRLLISYWIEHKRPKIIEV